MTYGEVNRLEQRVQELEKALEPFAWFAESFEHIGGPWRDRDNWHTNSYTGEDGEFVNKTIKVGDFTRAAFLLDQREGENL